MLPLGELENVTTITRLRRDAVVFEVPPPRKKGQRGASKKYDDRSTRPWDDADRRPSHEDRRNFYVMVS